MEETPRPGVSLILGGLLREDPGKGVQDPGGHSEQPPRPGPPGSAASPPGPPHRDGERPPVRTGGGRRVPRGDRPSIPDTASRWAPGWQCLPRWRGGTRPRNGLAELSSASGKRPGGVGRVSAPPRRFDLLGGGRCCGRRHEAIGGRSLEPTVQQRGGCAEGGSGTRRPCPAFGTDVEPGWGWTYPRGRGGGGTVSGSSSPGGGEGRRVPLLLRVAPGDPRGALCVGARSRLPPVGAEAGCAWA